MSEVSKGIRLEKTPEEIMNEKVFQSIGEASICWSVVPTGVFDSARAKRIGNELLDHIQKENQGLREDIAIIQDSHRRQCDLNDKAWDEYKRRTDEVNLLIKKQITDKEEIERLKELIKKKDKYLDQALRQWDMYASNSQENLDESFEMEGVIYREAQEALGLK